MTARRDTQVLAAVCLVFLVATVGLHAGHGLPLSWDDQGQYLSHARALLEGRPYGDIGFITTGYNNFIGPVVEPPGLPVLIAPALAVSGEGLGPVRLVMLASLIAVCVLAWRFIAAGRGTMVAGTVALLSLACFAERHAIDGIMSDLPFCVAVWVVILAADSDGSLTARRLAIMAAAGAMAFAFRMAALGLLPALMLFVLVRPRNEWRGLAGVGVAWSMAGALVLVGMPTSSSLAAESARGASRLVHDLAKNALAIQHGVLETFLYPFASNALNDVWHVLAGLLALAGLLELSRTRWRRSFAACFAVAYVAMLVVAPANAVRYWWPLVPFQLLALVEGAGWLVRRFTAGGRWIVPGAACLVALLALVRSGREPDTPFFERADVLEVVAAIRRAAPADSLRVSVYNPRLFTWHTRIPAMGHFRATPAETVAELRSKRIDLLVRGSMGMAPDVDASLDGAITAFPEAFEWIGEFGQLTLYRVVRQGSSR